MGPLNSALRAAAQLALLGCAVYVAVDIVPPVRRAAFDSMKVLRVWLERHTDPWDTLDERATWAPVVVVVALYAAHLLLNRLLGNGKGVRS